MEGFSKFEFSYFPIQNALNWKYCNDQTTYFRMSDQIKISQFFFFGNSLHFEEKKSYRSVNRNRKYRILNIQIFSIQHYRVKFGFFDKFVGQLEKCHISCRFTKVVILNSKRTCNAGDSSGKNANFTIFLQYFIKLQMEDNTFPNLMAVLSGYNLPAANGRKMGEFPVVVI